MFFYIYFLKIENVISRILMQNFEKLGLFYLGKIVNPKTKKLEKDLLLYESKDLTTHAVCVGMTGSGKTGLGITLLEEAALDHIPAIIIDPKGDLGNLLLTFPNLSAEEFRPWVDSASAEKKGMNSDEYAEDLSKTWKEGLAAWGENEERIRKFRDSVDVEIYTPASNAGIPISILRSFQAPSKKEMLDTSGIQGKILAITSSLLGLMGIDADPLKSREHTLISLIIQQAWEEGQDLDIPTLIGKIQKPPFNKIGALDIETFYPQKERKALSISLNNLLASPGFQAWMEGEPLDINKLLYTNKGKPKLSIISIAHLSDPERMFFVTLLLGEILSWVRTQSGTTSLRALLYMDEIFGFFPPTATPPSKLPMLTLLKQARAFGLGIILATQNPVDLDYKGLSNCGTWFIGRLQTERDKKRLIEGLKNASVGVGKISLDSTISEIGNRTFLMRSIHEKDLILFQTRWTMSYLYGPMTLAQISDFTNRSEEAIGEKKAVSRSKKKSTKSSKPDLSEEIPQLFAHPKNASGPVHYEPKLIGIAKLHFVNAKNKIDLWQDVSIVLGMKDADPIDWSKGENIPGLEKVLQKEPIAGSTFGELSSKFYQEKNYELFAKKLETSLYQNNALTLYQTLDPPLTSKPGEEEKDFRIRVALEMREKRDESVKKLRKKYEDEILTLSKKLRSAQEKMVEKQERASAQKTETMISVGSTILGTLFGRRVTKGTITQAGSTLKKAGRMQKESRDAAQMQQEIDRYQTELEELEAKLNREIASIGSPDSIQVETLAIAPRKSDISVGQVAVLWVYQ